MESLFKTEESHEEFRRKVTSILDNSYLIEETEYYVLKKQILELVATCLFDLTLAKEKLHQYNPEKVEILICMLDERKEKLIMETICLHNCKLGNVLTDFDWKLKIVMGRSDLLSIRYPVFQLILNYFCQSSMEPKSLIVELDKDQLKRLIRVLEMEDNSDKIEST